MLRRWFLEEYWKRIIFHHTWRRRTWWYEDIMSRVHITSKWRVIPSERVDSWKHKDWPSLGCEGPLSSRTWLRWYFLNLYFETEQFSWVRIVNGINKYVSETSEEISTESNEHGCTGQLVAKAKPRPKPTLTLSPVSIPSRERKWIDINPGTYSQDCFEVSKLWSDCYDMTSQLLEKTMEKWDLTTWQKSSRQNSMVLRKGPMMLG